MGNSIGHVFYFRNRWFFLVAFPPGTAGDSTAVHLQGPRQLSSSPSHSPMQARVGGWEAPAVVGILTLPSPLLHPSLHFSPQGSATLHHWQQLAQPHLGGILDPRPGVVTKGFRTLDVDLDEVYCLNDFEEDDTGDHISLTGLATSTPVQHPETSGERSRARVTVSGSRSYSSQPQASPEEMQQPPAPAGLEEEEEGSGEGTSISPVNLTPVPETELWALLSSVPGSIRSNSVSVASARLCG